MIRTRSIFPALVLLLVGLLAWPWNIALTASESAQQAQRPDHGSWAARKGRTHQVGRLSKCGLIGCAVIESEDYNESEDGDAVTSVDALVPGPVSGLIGGTAVSDRGLLVFLGGSPPRLTLLCRLRC